MVMPKNSDVQFPSWFEPYFKPHRHKVAYGGRGSSKSRSFGAALCIFPQMGHERILCTREFQTSIKESVKRLLEDEIERRGYQGFKIYRSEIAYPATDSLIMFAGLKTNPESIKSMEGVTKVWVEEAQTISQESIDLLIPTIRAEGSEIWWTFNRGMKTDPVDKMFFGKDGPPPDTLIRKVNYYDNPWFPDVLRQQMEWDRSRDPDKYRHVWLGEPVAHSESQVFYGCWSIAPVPEPPEETVFYYGADWGFAQDPTAIVRCWIEGKTLYVDREAGGVGIEIDDTPRLFDTVIHDRRWKITADSARPETISYMNRNGFNVIASKKGKGSIEDGIARLKGYNIVVDPSCKRVIEELSLYSYKTDKRTGEITPMIEDKNNHFLDALRYSTEALTRRKYFIPTL